MWQHESTARAVMEIPCLRNDVNGMRLLRDPINLRRHMLDPDKFQAYVIWNFRIFPEYSRSRFLRLNFDFPFSLSTKHPGVVLAVELTLKSLQSKTIFKCK
jgi:hypothetical protein